ncbi:MAG TPA: threonine-phosphate decarboxylase CobD [Methylophilaceae bacterium]|jgi:cobalamin biosynthetic protein CobC|nr:threonine-phosphate decarboxylase CobD [Methylophilaceae bacterium]
MLEHGGKLAAAAREHGIPLDKWVDLSTGIHPVGYPVPPIPPECWLRLPEEEDGLMPTAADYYATRNLLPCAGSQAAIQALPLLRASSRVGVLSPTYAEHAHAWRQAGHAVEIQADYEPGNLDVLVLANPNNPTGRLVPAATLLEWHAELASRGGWLVVDEAFMDATPEFTLSAHAGLPGLIILRSLGKFFGLAGIRAGFVLAWPELLVSLQERLGPWSVAHPTRWVAQQALANHAWQAEQRIWLVQQSQQLAELLTRHDLAPGGGTALFQWVKNPNAENIHHQLARLGILTRLFTETSSLRFGLPADERAWTKLDYLLP